jgi:hypothetical protein
VCGRRVLREIESSRKYEIQVEKSKHKVSRLREESSLKRRETDDVAFERWSVDSTKRDGSYFPSDAY